MNFQNYLEVVQQGKEDYIVVGSDGEYNSSKIDKLTKQGYKIHSFYIEDTDGTGFDYAFASKQSTKLNKAKLTPLWKKLWPGEDIPVKTVIGYYIASSVKEFNSNLDKMEEDIDSSY